MNKTFASLAGLIVFGTFAAWAVGQTPPTGGNKGVVPVSASAPAPAMPGTRVAILNINSVLKNYSRAQAKNNEVKTKVQGFAERMTKVREDIAKQQAEMAKATTTQPMREAIEKNVLNLNRQLQDIDAEARKVITEEQKVVAIQIFREIETVVNAVATTNNFDLVLSYPDATTTDELYSQDNVVRKLAAQAAIPLFYKKHIDITDAVVKTLNASYPAPTGTPGKP